jgi:undecaprenyl phosphate-alpha-L-ara4FN deformylase
MKIGLRIDVDTFRGTRDGVPNLLKTLADNQIRATFFFSVGPDNMGRHLWRLVKPAFRKKMIRSRAASLYGWDILLRGTLWPGPIIGRKLSDIIRVAGREGHEIGLHAWDHHAWQTHLDEWNSNLTHRNFPPEEDPPVVDKNGRDGSPSRPESRMPRAYSAEVASATKAGRGIPTLIHTELKRGFEMLSEIIGFSPKCSAVPGWKCTDKVLLEKEKMPFAYNSDCRGFSIFLPVVEGKTLSQPQVPVTLPTYDEVVRRGGITGDPFGGYLLSQLQENKLNVLTIHAEAEGIAIKSEFTKFVQAAKALGHEFYPLGSLIGDKPQIPTGKIIRGTLPGREGWVSIQQS